MNSVYERLQEEPATMPVLEMADVLGISKNKAYELTRIDGFPTFRIGRRILISKPGLLKWLEQPQPVLF